ncbi:unnamed protein product [Diatraea saccharalis]|uniref:Uncharacterized protein n=1 Tax=Diatraea saccharalis TaxID=40085 RepID=A0A9N9WC23_9NEOP|nr:unnamed protein product [Diatraea saccharalis]
MFFERIIISVFCLGIKALPWVLAEEVETREVATDKGTNVTIPCHGLVVLSASNVQWVHRGNHTHHEILVSYVTFYVITFIENLIGLLLGILCVIFKLIYI